MYATYDLYASRLVRLLRACESAHMMAKRASKVAVREANWPARLVPLPCSSWERTLARLGKRRAGEYRAEMKRALRSEMVVRAGRPEGRPERGI